ncbi:hypothetical protein HWV62_28950 [Athelia sp. TMB]|nr:hypothetical protein HWV62_28950 [Athelia sp. TMB]
MNATLRPQCLNGTRVDILESLIHDLTMLSPAANVIWLSGVAGAGKSTIATTIANYFHACHQLGAFLFFDRSGQSGPEGVLRTLAYQLAQYNSSFRKAIRKAIRQDSRIIDRPLSSQFDELLVKPLQACLPMITNPVIVVLDAFDECGDACSREALLYLLSAKLPLLQNSIRFFITSRPVFDLRNAFGSHVGIVSMSLDTYVQSGKEDVLIYIRHEIEELYQRRRETEKLPPGWPGAHRIAQLGRYAGDSFIWAATAIKYLKEYDGVEESLQTLSSKTTISLDDLYATALRSASNWDPKKPSTEICRKILGAIAVGQAPMTFDTIVKIWRLKDSDSCWIILQKLRCLLRLSEDLPITILHASFSDYLIACKSEPWFVDQANCHFKFAVQCLRVMEARLCFNICRLKTSHLMNRDVPNLPTLTKTFIPQYLEYTCRSWAAHASHAGTLAPQILPQILKLFQVRFLYWLEVLSLIGASHIALPSMNIVKKLSKDYPGDLHRFATDGVNFAKAFASVIADSAPHIYVSALAFAPSTSVIKKQYTSTFQNTLHVQADASTHWPSCELTVDLPEAVESVVFSPDGGRLVSFVDHYVCIFDAQTGDRTLELDRRHIDRRYKDLRHDDGDKDKDKDKGDEDVYDKDNDNKDDCDDDEACDDMACDNDDEDCQQQNLVGAFCLYSSVQSFPGFADGDDEENCSHEDYHYREDYVDDYVAAVAFSPNGEQIVSGSIDGTIHGDDEENCSHEEYHYREDYVNDYVAAVAFSPNGEQIASGSIDGTIHIWDLAQTPALLGPPLKSRSYDLGSAHGYKLGSVAFSPCGKRIMSSSSQDHTVCIWNVSSHEPFWVTKPFKASTTDVTDGAWHPLAVVFSPNCKRVLSCSSRDGIYVWRTRTGELITKPFGGHTNPVCFAVVPQLTPDIKLVSGSDDGTIHVWNACTAELIAGPFGGHTDHVRTVAVSPDGSCIASGSFDETVRISSLSTGELVSGPLVGHAREVRSVMFSPDGERVVSGSADKTIRIWSTLSEPLASEQLEGHGGATLLVQFSQNDQHIMSGSDDGTIWTWNVLTGKPVSKTFADVGKSSLMAFSPDGRCIAAVSNKGFVSLWDTEKSGPIGKPCKAYEVKVECLSFSLDGEQLVGLGTNEVSPNSIKIWNARTFQLIAVLAEVDEYSSIAISPNGKRIAAFSGKNFYIWDAETRNPILPSMTSPFESNSSSTLRFSPSGEHIVAHRHNSICVCNVQTGYVSVFGELEQFCPVTRWYCGVAFSPGGDRIASVSLGGTIHVWNISNGDLAAGPFEGHAQEASSVWHRGKDSIMYSSDGQSILTSLWDGNIRVIDLILDAHHQPRIGYCSSSQLKDGWMQNSPTELLFWVPPVYRSGLYRPYNSLVIGRESTKLNLNDFVHGEDWTQCYTPTAYMFDSDGDTIMSSVDAT